MKWEHFLRPEEEPAEGGMVGFRRQLLLFLGLFTFQGAFFFTPWATAPQNPPLSAVAAIVWSLALAIVTLLMRSRWPRKASWFYVLGGLLAATLVVYAFRNAIAPAVFALPVLTAGLLLGLFAGVTVGVGAGCLLVGLAASGANIDLVYWLLITGAITGIGALAGQFVSQVDYWERALVLQQQESIERLRDHQGELNRTLKALDEAYVSLQRTNAELALARRQAEEARALKEHFVASVSHELRTPLNIIVGFAEMMYLSPEVYEGVVWTPALEGDIQEMYRASRHLRSLVDDILDLSRIDASRLPMYRELADIRVIVNDAAETMAPLFRQRGLFLKVKLPEDLPLLFIDRTRIRQVLLNLLNNALRFTDKGGVHIQVEQGDRAVTVGVHDTGVGIPEDKLELIFEEFAQADPALHSRGRAGLG
ncbi:MAG: hypothetical protein H5T69_01600, partial [Chloroflexi bacterium]|nr:hypothetical protein [Chloroflexota bacterium]